MAILQHQLQLIVAVLGGTGGVGGGRWGSKVKAYMIELVPFFGINTTNLLSVGQEKIVKFMFQRQ